MTKCSKTDLTTGFQPEDDELSIRFRAEDGTWQFGTKIIKDGVVTFESPVGTVIAAPDDYEYNDPECPGAKTVSICGPVEVFTAGGFSGGGGGVDTTAAINANTAAVVANGVTLTTLLDLLTPLVTTDCEGNPALRITNPCASDLDIDGLTLAQELTIGTDPNNPDTDGGGVNDGDEVAVGGDPLDAGDDKCFDPSIVFEFENLGGNVSWKVSTDSSTGVPLPNLGDNAQYYDFSNCPQTTVPVSNLGDNVTYQLLP